MAPGARHRPRIRCDAHSSAIDETSASGIELALFAQRPECLLALDRFHPAALEIVVAAVERLANGAYLFEVSGKGILDDVLRSASARRSEILQFLGRLGRDVHRPTR
jgi:hypothetical protein